MKGPIEATGESYIPTEAYIWVNVTKIKFDQHQETTAIANSPSGKVADSSGSTKNVSGSGELHTLSKTVVAANPTLHFLKD